MFIELAGFVTFEAGVIQSKTTKFLELVGERTVPFEDDEGSIWSGEFTSTIPLPSGVFLADSQELEITKDDGFYTVKIPKSPEGLMGKKKKI